MQIEFVSTLATSCLKPAASMTIFMLNIHVFFCALSMACWKSITQCCLIGSCNIYKKQVHRNIMFVTSPKRSDCVDNCSTTKSLFASKSEHVMNQYIIY